LEILEEQEDRDRILLIAADLFRRKGYAGSTTRELAGLLGLKKASLYHYVESKEDLLYDICIEGLRRIDSAISKVEETAPADKRLQMMITRHVVSALEDRDLHAVMLIELRALTPARLALVIEHRDAYEDRIRSLIIAGQESRLLRTDITAKYLTLALLSMLNWTIFWYDPAGPLTPTELGDLLVTQFFDGARSGKTRQDVAKKKTSPPASASPKGRARKAAANEGSLVSKAKKTQAVRAS
jgi:AcrR family transcriptional regulator